MALTGNEVLQVQGIAANGMPAATTETTTTGAIAALANSEVTDIVNTAISTVGNGTLTAAALVGGVITRTGPVAVFTDTTATGAQLYTALGSLTSVSFVTRIKNTTAFAQTLAGGTGVTLPASIIIPANSIGTYLVTINTTSTATFVHISTTLLTNNAPEIITTLSTVGAGTITAIGIAGGVTSRTGSQTGTPFTDTTATADLIIAAQPNAHIGVSWEYTYINGTDAVATIAGDTGVTPSGITTVNPNMVAKFLVTYTAASTITLVGMSTAIYLPAGVASLAAITSTGIVNTGAISTTTSVTAASSIVTSVAVGTTSGAISNNGIQTINSTNQIVLAMAAPAVGVFKWIRSGVTATAVHQVNTTSATIGASTAATISFAGIDDFVILRGETTAKWGIYSKSTGVTTT